jgi:hypothetical protein
MCHRFYFDYWFSFGQYCGGDTESADEVSVLSQSESLGSIARFSIFFVALVVGIELRGINIQYHV